MSSETEQDRKIRPEVLKTDEEKNGLNISRCRTCKPGSTLKNKTGGWRNFRPVYIYEKCTKCGICEIVCPDMSVKPREDGFF